MKVSAILDSIDTGQMALPEFQRGFVWNRDQVRGLFEAMYRRYPVGSLLTWATAAGDAAHRADAEVAPGVVNRDYSRGRSCNGRARVVPTA